MVGSLCIFAKKRLANARVSSFRSQYHAVVRYRPCAVCSVRLWMSLMKANNAAGFMVLVMPNSFAPLSELEKSVPAFARPRTCAHAAGDHDTRGCLLQLRAKGVIGSHEVPGLAALLDDRTRRAVAQRGRVIRV